MADMQKIHDADEVGPLVEKSRETPVMIFKHSLICPISAMAWREFQRYLSERPADDEVEHVLVEIQNARPASNAIAEATGIRHESPQAILLRGGEAVWHESHSAIRSETLKDAVAA